MKTLGAIFLLFGPIQAPCEGSDLPRPSGQPAYPPLITEIMADPTPVAGLPEAEYIELYNPAGSEFSLAGCRLRMGTHVLVLPSLPLTPYGYIIICDAADAPLFAGRGPVAAVTSMPAVVNTGGTLTLESAGGQVLHTVTYSDRWYGSTALASGGRSLEMIDPGNRCGRAENWHTSVDPEGGTPGKANSVSAPNPDLDAPVLLRAIPGEGPSAILYFSENMDSASLADPAVYSAGGEPAVPLEALPAGPDYSSVRLTFPHTLLPGVTYTLTVLPVPTDCAGNTLAPGAGTEVALPVEADSFDVVIHEVLADASPGQSEFFEILNRSEKVLDLAEFTFTLTPATSAGGSRDIRPGIPFLLFPGKTLALSRDIRLLPSLFQRPDPAGILEIPSLFSLPDAEGILSVQNREGITLDRFRYDKSMHSSFLSHTEGVSLERIWPGWPTQDRDNWTSASPEAGYATPGRANSQGRKDTDTGDVQENGENSWILVSPPAFSPDGDGLDDAVMIGIFPGSSDCVAEVRIFSSSGENVAIPAHHVLVGSETWFTWEGTRKDGAAAGPGMYIIHAEIACRSGVVRKSRKVVALLQRF